MADPNVQAQTPSLTLTGGNDATNRYMNYYNQITTQLGGQHTPITPQVIEPPREMQAQQITAPERIQAERIATEDRTYGDYANEVASYLNPYLQNAIRNRRDQTADYRAAADADAWSRGMGGSTYLSDQKNQLAKAEARDIMAAQNEFLANVGQQAFSALQNQYNRNLQANMQNAANALAVDQFNANLANAVNQFNANALMQTDQYNIDNLLRIAIQNAQNDLNAQMANSEWEQYLQQLAWGWANQMYAANPIATGGGYVATPATDPGITGNISWEDKLAAKNNVLREYGYRPYEDTKKDYVGGSRGNNFANLNDNSGIFSVPR